MEILFEKNELASALIALGKLVSRTSALEANRCISIKAQNGWVTLTTSTADESLKYSVSCSSSIELDTVVDFDELKDAVRSCRTRMLNMGIMEGTIVVGDKVLTPKIGITLPEITTPEGTFPEVNLPEGFIDSFQALASVIDRNEYRQILHGINIDGDGFTATNGRELMNIPCDLKIDGFTIPLPLALMQTKSHDSGVLKKWLSGNRIVFSIVLPNWTYTAKALDGSFPQWQHVVPQQDKLTRAVSFSDEDRERLAQFVKCIPSVTEYNGVDLSKVDGELKLTTESKLEARSKCTFTGDWEDFSICIGKDILYRMLNSGHTKLECTNEAGPFKGSGGKGIFVGMPLRREAITPVATPEPVPTPATPSASVEAQPTSVENEKETIPNQTNNPTNKENKNMYGTNVTTIGAANPQPVTIGNEEVSNPFDELVDIINSLARKIKEVQIAQKQKERDFQLAKKIIKQLQAVSI